MRLKYQLRGLGIGIIIAAALLMVNSEHENASAKNADTIVMTSTEETTEEVSTSEVMETVQTEVKEIEVTETQESSDMAESVTEAVTEDISEVVQTEEATTQEIETIPETAEEEITTEEETTQTVADADVVEIKIVRGDDSGTVARKLQVAGLVDNASEYDAYLMQHGYDKKISVGTVTIVKGSSWQEIAEKISGRK